MCCRVALPQSDGVRLLQAVKVDGDAEGDRDLVRPGVPLADGAGAVVHLVANVIEREVLGELRDQGREVRVVRERQDGALEGSDDRGDAEECPGLVSVPDLEAVLEDCIHDPPDTERGLDHTRGDLLDMERLLVLLNSHHVLAEGDVLPVALEAGLSPSKLGLELTDLVEAELGEHLGHVLGLFLEGLAQGALVGDDLSHLLGDGGGQLLLSGELDTSGFGVTVQVKGRPGMEELLNLDTL